jgi:hypothetical protein
MLAWDWLSACPFLHDLDSEILMVTDHFLLKADRLEANSVRPGICRVVEREIGCMFAS